MKNRRVIDKKTKKRGQAGIEAVVALGIIFFLFIGVYLIYTAKNRDLSFSKKVIEEREDCLKLANAIVNTFTLGDSAEMTITTYHDLTVIPVEQRIETTKSFCTIPVKTIHENSDLTLSAGKIKLKNERSYITLSNI